MTDQIGETMQLIHAAQSGKREAVERLLERYYPRVLKIVRLRMGPKLRLRMESADILQEVFLAALRGFDDFEMRDEGSLIHWLGTIVAQRLASAAEHEGAKRRAIDREVRINAGQQGNNASMGASTATFDLKVDTLVPLDKAIRNEQQLVVEECIGDLPDQYREVVLLRNYTGLSFVQIAEKTSRPSEGAARMMHAKAMIELTRLVRARLEGKSAAPTSE